MFALLVLHWFPSNGALVLDLGLALSTVVRDWLDHSPDLAFSVWDISALLFCLLLLLRNLDDTGDSTALLPSGVCALVLCPEVDLVLANLGGHLTALWLGHRPALVLQLIVALLSGNCLIPVFTLVLGDLSAFLNIDDLALLLVLILAFLHQLGLILQGALLLIDCGARAWVLDWDILAHLLSHGATHLLVLWFTHIFTLWLQEAIGSWGCSSF